MSMLSSTEKKRLCKNLSNLLPTIRSELGISLKDLSCNCGISVDTLSAAESGCLTLSWTQFCAISYICFSDNLAEQMIKSCKSANTSLLNFSYSVKQVSTRIRSNSYFNKSAQNKSKCSAEDDMRLLLSEFEKVCSQEASTSSAIFFEYFPYEDLLITTLTSHDGIPVTRSYEHYFSQKGFIKTMHPEYIASFTDMMHEASEKISSGVFEYLSKHTSDSYAWHRIAYSSIPDKFGKIIKIIGKVENMNQVVSERDTAVELASKDLLTGLKNKCSFYSFVNSRLKQTNASNISLIMIDIDNFKYINDSIGHLSGDEVLKKLSNLLLNLFPSPDIIGRFGGDEFLIFSENSPHNLIENKVEKLRSSVYLYGKKINIKLSVSIGAWQTDNTNVSLIKMIEKADKAMYTVKNNGKNGFLIEKDNNLD